MAICHAVLGLHLLLVSKNSIHSCPDESNVQLAFLAQWQDSAQNKNFKTEITTDQKVLFIFLPKTVLWILDCLGGEKNYRKLTKSSNNMFFFFLDTISSKSFGSLNACFPDEKPWSVLSCSSIPKDHQCHKFAIHYKWKMAWPSTNKKKKVSCFQFKLLRWKENELSLILRFSLVVITRIYFVPICFKYAKVLSKITRIPTLNDSQ